MHEPPRNMAASIAPRCHLANLPRLCRRKHPPERRQKRAKRFRRLIPYAKHNDGKRSTCHLVLARNAAVERNQHVVVAIDGREQLAVRQFVESRVVSGGHVCTPKLSSEPLRNARIQQDFGHAAAALYSAATARVTVCVAKSMTAMA